MAMQSMKDSGKNSPMGELLAEMHRNVTMGSESLAAVVPHIRDKFLLTDVTAELEQYAGFTRRTEAQLAARHETAEDLTPMKKMMARGGIALNTLFDDSTSHIAEMIVEGTRRGADSLSDKLAMSRAHCTPETIALCEEIVDYERREVERMRDYCGSRV